MGRVDHTPLGKQLQADPERVNEVSFLIMIIFKSLLLLFVTIFVPVSLVTGCRIGCNVLIGTY